MKKSPFFVFFECLAICLGTFALAACSDNSASAEEFNAASICPESGRGTFIDERDGQVYKYTTIGNQFWMAENLRYKIKEDTDADPSNDFRSECFFSDDSCSVMGLVYNWNAAKGACPRGWHLPSEKEWNILIGRMGGDVEANYRLRATSGWKELNRNENLNGSDDCGFMLLPSQETYKPNIGYVADAWSSSEGSSEDNELILFFRVVSYRTDLKLLYTDGYKSDLKSIRCLKD
jgi:uncharacterized protein (TIGR02145 family)